MNKLSSKDLLGIKDLSLEEIELIFDTASKFKEVLSRPIKKVPTLRHLTVANVFFENSTRTKLSFELAEKRLSADIINFSSSVSSVKKGETLLDTINNILVMKVDMLVIRHPNPGAPHFIANNIDASVINAGDGTHEHPTQALLDAAVIKEEGINLEGLKIAICGDILNSRVARSNIYLLTTMGAQVSVIGPPTLIPKDIERMGVKVFFDLDSGLKSSDIIMILRLQNERMDGSETPSKREYYSFFGINENNLKLAKKNALVMHPGPMNRGVEIASLLADNNEISLVKKQVKMGVSVKIACLEMLKLSRNKLLK